jgi:hypothetical protein
MFEHLQLAGMEFEAIPGNPSVKLMLRASVGSELISAVLISVHWFELRRPVTRRN